MELLNLTQHPITIRHGKLERVIPPSGTVARISTSVTAADPIDGIPVQISMPGTVEGLPGSRPGVYLIVSLPVRQALPGRSDLLSPGGLLRGDNGAIEACSVLLRSPTPATVAGVDRCPSGVIHVGIVSEQLLPNAIPVLMEPPDEMVLLCSDTMLKRGLPERLATYLRNRSIRTTIRAGLPEGGWASTNRFAHEVARDLRSRYPQADLVFNATGGTKLMSLAFVQAFQKVGGLVIYVDTAGRCVESLGIDGAPDKMPMPVESVLNVPDYLEIQGFEYERALSDDPGWLSRANSRREASLYLGDRAVALESFIGTLNWHGTKAAQAAQRGDSPSPLQQRLTKKPMASWVEALDTCARCGILRWEPGSQTIEFADEESLRFLRGGWLEEYLWHAFRDAGATDCRLGVEGRWLDGTGANNEFDLLATYANEMLMVECKTLRVHEQNESEIAYKLESLGRSVRGRFGQSWLASARPVSKGLTDRAHQWRIKTVGPEEFRHIGGLCRAWVKGVWT